MLHMLPGREMAGHLEARVKRQHDLFHVVRLKLNTLQKNWSFSSLFVLLLCSCLHPQNQTK